MEASSPPDAAAAALQGAEQAFADAHAALERARAVAADDRRRRRPGRGSARLARLDGATASAAEIVAVLRRDGTVVLEGMMRPAQMDSLQQELAVLEPFAHRAEPGSFSGENTVSNGPYLVAACPTAQELALHPKLIEVVEGILSPYARRVALAVASEIKVSGAGPAQVLHRDDEEWPLDLLAHKKVGAELELNTMWAVSDFAAESGATQQVPGSHRWPAGREPHDDEIVTAEMPRGSVLLWLGSTLHGAGASVAGAATRHGMLLGYVSINTLPAQLLFKRRLRLHRRAPPPPHALPQARTSVSFGWPRALSSQVLPIVAAAGDEHAGEKTALFAPFIYKMHYFTKTGSGRT